MKIRVCPVCDQKMASAHYCKTCRRFVRHPYIRNVNYYMNEQPPQANHNQEEFRQEHRLAPHIPPSPPLPGKTYAGEQWRPVGQHGAPNGSKVPFVIFIILLFTVVLVMLGVGLFFRNDRLSEDVWSTVEDRTTAFEPDEWTPDDYNLDDFNLDEWVENFEELTNEEVILAGEACNTCGHFQTTGQEMDEMVVQFIKEEGYRVDSRTEYSRNERYGDGDTWFSSSVVYYLKTATPDTYPMVSVDADTATGQLHEVGIVLEEPEAVVEMSRKVLSFLAEMGEYENDEEVTESMLAELTDAFEWDDEFSMQTGGVDIYGYVFDGDYMVYISCEL